MTTNYQPTRHGRLRATLPGLPSEPAMEVGLIDGSPQGTLKTKRDINIPASNRLTRREVSSVANIAGTARPAMANGG